MENIPTELVEYVKQIKSVCNFFEVKNSKTLNKYIETSTKKNSKLINENNSSFQKEFLSNIQAIKQKYFKICFKNSLFFTFTKQKDFEKLSDGCFDIFHFKKSREIYFTKSHRILSTFKANTLSVFKEKNVKKIFYHANRLEKFLKTLTLLV